MPAVKQTVLRFELRTTGNPMEVLDRFHPQGKRVLNRTQWRGKEPRTCGVTKVRSRPHAADSKEPLIFDVEVSYRPKGCITFVGNTKYDGWTAMLLDRTKDGTLLDGHGQPLPKGQPPVHLSFEMYPDIEFNEIDFGKFVGESEVQGIQHVQYDDVMCELQNSAYVRGSITTSFMAPHRHRPLVKIILSNAPSGTGTDEWRTKLINVNNSTPHLEQAILDHLTELVSGFLEARYSMNCIGNDDFVVVQLSDALVDCTPNERGEESRFNCIGEYVSPPSLDELAMRLMSTFEVDVTVVFGDKISLLFRKAPSAQ